MVWSIPQDVASAAWALARSQHGVVARWQLLELGFTRRAIEHRVAKGRLHPMLWGVYAVGRPDVTQCGWWIAAVLACGPGARLSHDTAAALWGIRPITRGFHVSAPGERKPAGITPHRRVLTAADLTRRHNIPVTSPITTLIDIAAGLSRDELEAAINEADKRGLTNPVKLRAALDTKQGRTGVRKLRTTLDRRTFVMTDTELERRFLPIVRRAGLPLPLTQTYVNGYRVDFYWPDLGLVIETDGLTYHRTPAQQAADRVRDQTHTAADLTPLRFTRAQVKYEPGHVEAILSAVADRLGRGRRGRRT
jgi:very-short-patch-repair endonuclease